ncbi:NAD(P)H-quinone oxidoreductase subunit S isoform X2 [Tasmannia lanceolata]|uniref:NAD(P)H-quinone oxidoreductase subunit S isoform X2 n=1 Tax=Tasmannia lanceolata TaxID=3420 RepID=UPI0040628F30
MASSFILPTLRSSPLHKSTFLGNPTPTHLSKSPSLLKNLQKLSTHSLTPSAKFNLFELLGGRGLCNGEKGVQQELEKPIQTPPKSPSNQETSTLSSSLNIDEDAFEKELLGLTGGFPGGEKGLQKFVEQNPSPKTTSFEDSDTKMGIGFLNSKPKPPKLPLLMPGMIVIVKNPRNAYHMYCGIIQRITDGRAGVLFEGGNWDKLITFELTELERRDKGPPMAQHGRYWSKMSLWKGLYDSGNAT